MTRLRIRNFGPVTEGCTDNDGWIEFRKVTLFIGDQGSGKSTVAKLFSIMSWIEKALVRGDMPSGYLSTHNRFSKQLAFQRINNYTRSNSVIEYSGREYHFNVKGNKLRDKKNGGKGYFLPKIMYVPAERNFLSVIDRPDKLKNLPAPLFTFLEEYDHARNYFAKGLKLPIGNANFEYDTLNKIAHLKGNNYKLRLSEASSGFQSTVPLYLVTKFLTESLHLEEVDPSISTHSVEEYQRLSKLIRNIINDKAMTEEVRQVALRQLSARFKPVCLINIVEEPEQNLFPASQGELMNSLLSFTNLNEGNKLILTTHSPYLINYLSIAIQGWHLYLRIRKLKDHTKLLDDLEEVVPLTSVINPKDVAIYQMNEKEGTISLLPDFEGIPSDSHYLNQLINEGNTLFDKLLEIEEQL